jgi:para-aminobenzoate synthetase component 1
VSGPGTAPLLRPGAQALVRGLPWIEPLEALRRLEGRRHTALLYSGLAGEHPAARHSILACDPVAVIEVRGLRTTLAQGVPFRETRTIEGDPFVALRALLPEEPGADGLLPFGGGAIGYLGYGMRRSIEHLPACEPEPFRLPDAWFGVYDAAVVFDHAARGATLLALPRDGEPDGIGARGRLDDLAEVLLRPAANLRTPTSAPPHAGRLPPAGTTLSAESATRRDDYLLAVRRVLDHIARGDLYQVNLSHRIRAPLRAEPINLFFDLMRHNPAPFSAWLDAGPFQIVCASPERFLSLVGGLARSSPIKGTRPRGALPEDDLLYAADLRRSAKDRAENVMIADLVRNDLGRVAVPGSVRVETLCGLESFATVHHLVTTVEARLQADADRIDLLRALFPGGSMTGAPKVRAMQVIAALEREERGPYSGAIGYLSRGGGLDLNIVIRTLLCCRGEAGFRVGGGIVADSDPETEWLETLAKGRALLDVLGARLA